MDDVANNGKTTEKLLGGITGKGFMPGKSGNPNGRPKKRPISDRYAAIAELPLEENIRLAMKLPEGATYGDAVALSQMRAAIKGKTDAAREMREAIEGKATQRVELAGPDSLEAEIRNMSIEEIDQRLEELLSKAGLMIQRIPQS
jgi:hypothetical protein